MSDTVQELRHLSNSEIQSRINALRTRVEELNGLAHQEAGTVVEIAALLFDLNQNDYCQRALGIPLREFVTTQLKDAHGRPWKWDRARSLLHHYQHTLRFPELLGFINNQDPHGKLITLNTTSRVAKLYDEVKPDAKAKKEWLDEHGHPNTPEDYVRLDEHVKAARQSWLWDKCQLSVAELNDDLRAERVGGRQEQIEAETTYLGGRIDNAVKGRYDELIDQLLAMQQDTRKAGTMTFVQQVELMVETLDWFLDAIKDTKDGNTTKLRSILEVLN